MKTCACCNDDCHEKAKNAELKYALLSRVGEELAKENERLKETIRSLAGAIRSINRSPHHVVNIPGDDEPCYWQRKEWVDWILEEADNAEYGPAWTLLKTNIL